MSSTSHQGFREGDKVYQQHRDGTRGYGRVIGFTSTGRAVVAGRGLVERSVDQSRLRRGY